MNLPKRIHIIGICGVATSALGIAFKNAGVKVTGSDKGFFPPVSTELEKAGIPFYAGWHPEKITEGGTPDFVIAGTASGTQNPETAYAKEHGIPIKSDAEVRGGFFAEKNSIVCAGTWGKTSSTAILSHILMNAGFDPSFVIGGLSLSSDAARLGNSDWSIIEGDEYKSSPWDDRPKFEYLHASHLLLTAVSWDHADLYPTEAAYFDAFKKLVASIPSSGLIIANKDQTGVTQTLAGSNDKEMAGKKVVWYGKDAANYSYGNISQSKDGLTFEIVHQGKSFEIKSPMLGSFQAENITGCFATAHQIGIPTEKIISAIASFKGLKRRLEKRSVGTDSNSGVTIFDDIAHSPEKASAVLKELRQIYSGKIIAVFEPNIGGREREAVAKYSNAFKDADTVLIPRLTKLKVAENDSNQPMEGLELASVISKTHNDCHYIEDDTKLVESLASQSKKGDIIVFLGSHGFRGMIEETTTSLRRRSPS